VRRLGNTLYVTTQGTVLSKEGETIRVAREGIAPLHVPIHGVDGILCFGGVTVTPPLLGQCAERGVTVSWLTEYGRFLARAEGPVSGNVLLRRAQYRASDDPAANAALARSIVVGKTFNQRVVVQRYLRDHGIEASEDQRRLLDSAGQRLVQIIGRLERNLSTESVRGLEGEAAAVYYAAFPGLIRSADFRFSGRERRPPRDPVNALLSFAYTLLTHDARSALEGVGLDSAVGFLHRDRPGRPSLALDLVEEFRAWFADRLVLSLINRRQVRTGDFEQQPGGAVVMTEAGRKTFLIAYQERKREEVRHPFTNEKMMVGLLWHEQARLLAAALRGDLDAYPPFAAR
jgi:CRISPR-associated protein Cas1